MVQPLARAAHDFATEPVRVWAWLRLPMIALIAAWVHVGGIEHWLPVAYDLVLGVYAAAALGWLAIVLRGPVPSWAGWASTATDVLAVLVMCIVSGGATAVFLPLFFLLPLAVAFQDRPARTALLGTGSAFGYLAVWIVYSKRDDAVGLPNVVYVQFAFLLWLAVATTALCFVLTRRAERVAALLDVRHRLISESMRADDKHTSELAEQLHDGPLQSLLVARLDLEEARERYGDPALDAVDSALRDTASRLRSTVSTLHPQVLAALGLTPALRELIRQYEHRFAVEAELEEVGQSQSQSLLYRAARELLANAHKHANPTSVRIRLLREDGNLVLTVVDDGTGFDPAILGRCVAEGHIGLGSLMVRIEAVGGTLRLESAVGQGTRATATVPDAA